MAFAPVPGPDDRFIYCEQSEDDVDSVVGICRDALMTNKVVHMSNCRLLKPFGFSIVEAYLETLELDIEQVAVTGNRVPTYC